MKRWLIAALAIGAVGAGAFQWYLKPAVLDAAPLLIQDAVEESLNGTVRYKDLDIGWDLNAVADGIELFDATGKKVACVDRARVSWSLWRVLEYLAAQREVLGVIDGITLTRPEVFLWEETDRSWNVANLIKSSEEPTEMSLRSKIIVNGGEAHLEFLDEPTLHFTDIRAMVDLNNYPTSYGDVTFNYLDAPVHGRGVYTETDDFSVDITAAALPIILVQRFVPPDIPLSIRGGKVEDLVLHAERHGVPLQYKGDAKLAEGSLRYEEYNAEEIQGKLQFETDMVSFHDVRLMLNEQPLQGQGRVHLGEDTILDIDIMTTGAEVSALAEVPLHGPVAANVHLGGSTSDLRAEGIAALERGCWENTPLQQVFTRFTYRNDVVTIPDLLMGIGDGRLRGSGYYNLLREEGEGSFNAEAIDISLLPLDSYALSGTADAVGHVRLAAGALADLSVKAEGTGIGASGMYMDTLALSANYENDAWQIYYANGTMGDGSFTARGNTNTATGISVQGEHLPLARFAGLTGIPMAGSLSLAGRIHGDLSNPVLTADIAAHDGHIHRMPFSSINGHLEYAENTAYIRELFWTDADGMHRAEGTVQLAGNRILDLSVKSDHVRVENVLAVADTDIPVTGWMQNDMTIGGTLDAPLVQGSVHLWDGSVMGEIYQDVTARYRYAGDTVYIDAALAQMYKGMMHAKGYIRPDYFDFELNASGISIDRVLRENNTPNLQGYVGVEGRAYGSPSDPVLDVFMYGSDVTANGEPVDEVQAEVHYRNNILTLENAYVRQDDGIYEFSGGYWPETGKIYGSGNVNRADMPRLSRLVNIPADHIKGTLIGEVEIGGTVDNPSLSVRGRMIEGSVLGKPIGQTDLDMDYADRNVVIRKLRMPIGDGILAAAGKADIDGEIEIQVAAQNIDVSYLPAFANEEMDLQGNLSFSAVLGGKTMRPEMDMSFEVDGGSYNGMQFDRFIGLLNLEDDIIKVNQTLLQREPYQLSVYGTVPVIALTKEGRASGKNESMDLQIRLDQADLDLLTVFTPAVLSASGETKGGLTISGTLADPYIDGRIYVEKGTMTVQTMKNPLTDINADLRFHGKQADWTGSFELGGGTVDITGNVAWSSFVDAYYGGEVNINNINPQSTYYDGPLNGKLVLDTYLGRPRISGHLDIEDTKMDIPFEFGDDGGGEPIYLDIDVNVGDKVRLYNSYLYDMHLTGSIHAGGSTANPDMTGRINVTKGHLKYLNNKFRINEGRAEFNRSDSFLPYLYVNADTKFNRYRINMEATGLPTDVELKLTSEPALSEEEIITMLTLQTEGKIEDLGKEDADVLLGVAAQMLLFGDLENRLQNALGLDMINITTGSIDPFETDTVASQGLYNIEIGKYLFDDFMLILATGVNNEQQSIGAKYDLNRSFGVNAWVNSEDNYYFGGEWRKRF